jgi:hypothetical protein
MDFAPLLPMLPPDWEETLDETLAAIKIEAEEHPTEFLVLDTAAEPAVSRLRARAVILAHALTQAQARIAELESGTTAE